MPAPTPDRLDPDAGQPRPIDALTRRVVMMLFASGLGALLLNWFLEWSNGALSDLNAWAYPVLAAICGGLLLALWRRPALLRPVRWVGFLAVTVYLLGDLAAEVASPQPMRSSYNALTLLNWLPLCHALAFFLLDEAAAAWASGGVLAAVATAAVVRGQMTVSGATGDRDLLLNALTSQVVLVVALTSMVWLKRVVTRQVEQARQLRLLAGTDPLTDLANRRRALLLLERLVADRRSGSAPAVLLADLDHFKRINDRCGHEMGDRVLCEVATALREHTRDTDTVARWGGEEFLVVLPRTQGGEPRDLAERLRACIEALTVRDARGREVPVTLSIGIAALGPSDTVARWLRRADEALYRAKDEGRNRCVEASEDDVEDAGLSVLDEPGS